MTRMHGRGVVAFLGFVLCSTALAATPPPATGAAQQPSGPARGESRAAVARRRLAALDPVLTQAIADFQVPGLALAVVAGGEVIYARGFGLRDIDKKLPVTPDTLFAIGSTTKAMTATVLGMLADEGKLTWDEPVRRYLPWFRLSNPEISERLTVRDLVTHRSGLPRHDLLWYNYNEGTRRGLIERLASLELTADLREKFQYNNLLFMTAGFLAGELAGTTWEQLVRTRLFAPLGMKRSNFSVLDAEKDPDHALPYDDKGEKDGALKRIPYRRIDLVGPAGAVNSSANEMARWLLLNLSGGKVGERQLIQASTLADIQAPHMTTGDTGERPDVVDVGYGHGWGIDAYRGHRRVQHGGGIDGFITMVTLLPDDDLGIVSFVNTGVGLPGLVNQIVADRVLDLPPVDWLGEALAKRKQRKVALDEAKKNKAAARIAGTQPSHKLEDYVGDYHHPGYGPLRIAAGDASKGSLTLTFNGITAPLEHWHYDVWNGGVAGSDETFEDQKLLFRSDVNGEIAAVEATFEPSAAPIVFTKQPPARLLDPKVLARYVGRYALPGEIGTVSLGGSGLQITVPGQPTYTLRPEISGRFVLKEVRNISVSFVEEGGKAVKLILHQPQGVYEAKRVE
ncbi:MAG TPA: serine hydrolase [Polyangia bacterium]|nr:serine hydrolase [Polyangia bacterium]